MSTAVRTGYEIREGSQILAARWAEKERNEAIAEKILRHARIKALAGQALFLVDLIEGRVKVAA